MRWYDIVVIGGGPGGATFARELAKVCPDRKIALVDAKPKTGSKVCGGLLAPDAQKVLAQFDLSLPKSVLADPQIFDVRTLDLPSGIERHYQRHYLNMDRAAFDEWLLSLIPEQVDIIRGRCVALSRCPDSFRLAVDRDGEKEEILAARLVGADGGSSIVRRQFFGLPAKQYVAIQEHFVDSGANIANYSCIFDPVTSTSCSWTIRKDGYVIFGGAFDREGCREAYEKQKERLEKYLGRSLGKAFIREACLVTSPRRPGDFVLGRDGVFLVGEAAGFVSASSFEGISSAFLSGKYLADAFAQGEDAQKILRLYQRKTAKLRLKLLGKIVKMRILFCPFLRRAIMQCGICSIDKYSLQECRSAKKPQNVIHRPGRA